MIYVETDRSGGTAGGPSEAAKGEMVAQLCAMGFDAASGAVRAFCDHAVARLSKCS